MLTNAEFSPENEGNEGVMELGNGKSLKGCQTSSEKGSKMLLLRQPKKLGMSDISCYMNYEVKNSKIALTR